MVLKRFLWLVIISMGLGWSVELMASDQRDRSVELTDKEFEAIMSPNPGCRSLRVFGIDDTQTANFQYFTNLERLDLSSCNLTDEGIINLPVMQRLQSLNLSGQGLTDQTLPVIARLFPTLTELNLSTTLVRGETLEELLQLPQLRLVKINDTGTQPKYLQTIKAKMPLAFFESD